MLESNIKNYSIQVVFMFIYRMLCSFSSNSSGSRKLFLFSHLVVDKGGVISDLSYSSMHWSVPASVQSDSPTSVNVGPT